MKAYSDLTLLEVNNAGHQVPMFVPKQVSHLYTVLSFMTLLSFFYFSFFLVASITYRLLIYWTGLSRTNLLLFINLLQR